MTYCLLIRRIFRYFDRSQFLVLSTERLKTAQGCQQQMDRVFAFLGLPRYVLPDTTPKNTAKQVSASAITYIKKKTHF